MPNTTRRADPQFRVTTRTHRAEVRVDLMLFEAARSTAAVLPAQAGSVVAARSATALLRVSAAERQRAD